MAWWLAVPLAIWAGKKLYDAVTSDSGSSSSASRDYDAAARMQEKEERKELARKKASMNLQGYLKSFGIEQDVSAWVTSGDLLNESGRKRFVAECVKRFGETPSVQELAEEHKMSEVAANSTRLALLALAAARAAYEAERMLPQSNRLSEDPAQSLNELQGREIRNTPIDPSALSPSK